MPKITLWMGTSYNVNSYYEDEIEIDDDEWAAMDEVRQEREVQEWLEGFVNNNIESGWVVQSDGD